MAYPEENISVTIGVPNGIGFSLMLAPQPRAARILEKTMIEKVEERGRLSPKEFALQN